MHSEAVDGQLYRIICIRRPAIRKNYLSDRRVGIRVGLFIEKMFINVRRKDGVDVSCGLRAISRKILMFSVWKWDGFRFKYRVRIFQCLLLNFVRVFEDGSYRKRSWV